MYLSRHFCRNFCKSCTLPASRLYGHFLHAAISPGAALLPTSMWMFEPAAAIAPSPLAVADPPREGRPSSSSADRPKKLQIFRIESAAGSVSSRSYLFHTCCLMPQDRAAAFCDISPRHSFNLSPVVIFCLHKKVQIPPCARTQKSVYYALSVDNR